MNQETIDSTLNKSTVLNASTEKRCCCTECNNKATKFLRITWMPPSGFFCEQCSLDLIWHGIGQVEEEERKYDDDGGEGTELDSPYFLNRYLDKTTNGN